MLEDLVAYRRKFRTGTEYLIKVQQNINMIDDLQEYGRPLIEYSMYETFDQDATITLIKYEFVALRSSVLYEELSTRVRPWCD